MEAQLAWCCSAPVNSMTSVDKRRQAPFRTIGVWSCIGAIMNLFVLKLLLLGYLVPVAIMFVLLAVPRLLPKAGRALGSKRARLGGGGA